ncbi:MAG TPA: low temperature requirement protein A [Actinocrinis sp.]|nr:low temperature requirement protein A [Actinocrinis sp.]
MVRSVEAEAGEQSAAPFTLVSRMRARQRDEEHRASTPLELFFDLSFVVAVAQAGQQLVHAVADGQPWHGVGGYLLVFFAIWWAWVNFSWFASAYDNDDVPYRLATLVQIAGVLVLAAGVPRAFQRSDFAVVVLGYVIMRIVQTGQWLRAARGEIGAARRAAQTYAAGLVVMQVSWVLLLLVPHDVWLGGFVLLAVAEMAVPAIAERVHDTPWHPHHISERYGLFTIITLGESVSAATIAVQSALDDHAEVGELLPIAAGGLIIVFAAYWLYFAVPIHDYVRSNRQAFAWGYGHYLIFGSAAAIGAGLAVAVQQVTHQSPISANAAAFAVTIPTTLYLMAVWFVHLRHFKSGLARQALLPCGAVLVLAVSFAGHWAVLAAGLVAAATVGAGAILAVRTQERRPYAP